MCVLYSVYKVDEYFFHPLENNISLPKDLSEEELVLVSDEGKEEEKKIIRKICG